MNRNGKNKSLSWQRSCLPCFSLRRFYCGSKTITTDRSQQLRRARWITHTSRSSREPLIPTEVRTEGVPTRDVTTVTSDTKVILGVTTIVVHDQAYEDGVLVEDTFDWYAQDKDGNVWYFGEDTKELDENGNVISTEGSWEAGVDGAEPGIIMEANPKKGDKYQQEFAPDVAEDMAQVIGFEDSFCVPYGCFEDVLVTKEWTPLEKGVVENKYYAQGVGFLSAVMVKGGDEQTELVRVR